MFFWLMRKLQLALAIMTVITLPVVALANVPMALVYGIERYIYIPIVLIVEWLVLKFFFGFSWGKAATASITVNAITYVIGFFAFPLLGFFVYQTPLIDLIGVFITQGSLGELILIMLVAALVDTAIELSVLKAGFKRLLNKRRVIVWLLANLATAAIVLLGVGVEKGLEIASGKRIDPQEVECIREVYAAELSFMKQVGEDAVNNISEESWGGYSLDWKNRIMNKTVSFPSILRLYLKSGKDKHASFGSSPRLIGGYWKSLGIYNENNLTVEKYELETGLTIYNLELKSPEDEGYKVSATLEADSTCLNPNSG